MKFKHGTRRPAIEYEKEILEYWKKNKIFEKSIENRDVKNSYIFYDGPPFITGLPHHGTLLSSIVKDVIPRYQTMKGNRVERRWGWDCHGLPAENFVEQQLGIEDRRQIGNTSEIEKDGKKLPPVSLEKYITKARESMVASSETWESTIDRIGRWVDFRGAYRTMDKDFMESVWWAFKKLFDASKIYEGEKVLMYDTKFATPVSKNEITMDNDAYQTVTDPSVYVKFKLTPESIGESTRSLDLPVYFLAWTTTPWTLPANVAVAVNPELTYSEVRVGDEIFILAKDLVEKVLIDEKKNPLEYEVIHDEILGSKLIGKKVEPLFINRGNGAHQVYAADYVEAEAGTGIVHLAPIYGEIDFELAEKEGIPKIHVLDDNGYYLPEMSQILRELFKESFGEDYTEILKKAGVETDTAGNYEVWSVNKMIAKALKIAGKVWKIESIRHEYPFNPRSKQRIMYRAIPSWFFDIQNSKPLMLAQNENINWFPPHLKHGRFMKNIEQAPDWTLSRNRFWATAMPVWKGDKGSIKVIGSYKELEELSGKKLDDYHRPWIDEVKFEINGEKFERIPEVLDCWFESGSMPFAQFHYPFKNKEKFESNYPGDFIVEYVGQVRAWFYYVHAINTALAEIGAFGDNVKNRDAKNAFKNVITTGIVAGNDGRKMSKSLGNFTDPNELMDKYSADSLRFLLLSSPLLSGEDFALQDKDVSDVARKLAMIWNMYDFFTMYAEVDGWEFKGEDAKIDLENPLDIWILSRLCQLREEITKNMDNYNIPDAMAPILPFIDDASNWYVRRSRRRFWKTENSDDKNQAYYTLHLILRKLAVLLAPFTPFLAEELYQKLTGEESVHLTSWSKYNEVDQKVIDDMKHTREIIEKGLAARMIRDDEFGQIKVRQPLAKLIYAGEKLDDFYEKIIAEEVNVKKVEQGSQLALDKKLTSELKQEGFVRELIRFIQSARKKAGLNVDDRIKLAIIGAPEFVQDYAEILKTETLATEITTGNYDYDELINIDDQEITISLEKN